MGRMGAGIKKLSELEIDADKDWAAKKIENLGAPDSGDDAPRDDTIDSKITTHKGDASAHHAKTTSIGDLTDHDKAAHDALGIDADTVDGAHKTDLEPDFPMKLKPALTRYVMPGWLISSGVTTDATAGKIFYTPIFVSETTTYTGIGIMVGTAAEGSADLRIFEWDNGIPGSLILSAGTVDTGTTGVKEIVINQQLARGYYFLAVRCTATPKLYGAGLTAVSAAPVSGFIKSGGANVRRVVLVVSAAYSDPAPAPTDAYEPNYAFVFLKET